MKYHEKQKDAWKQKDIFSVDLHHFSTIEGDASYLEIASELGISIGEVKLLKKNLGRA